MAKTSQEMGLWTPQSIIDASGLRLDKAVNISDALKQIQEPVNYLKNAVHTEFSGVNLRGLPTHDVIVTRRTRKSSYDSYNLKGLDTHAGEMGLVVNFNLGEVKFFDPLRMFMAQVGIIDNDHLSGGLVLEDYDKDLDESSLGYRVALMKGSDTTKEGILFSSWGKVSLVPEPKINPASSRGDRIFDSKMQQEAYEAFTTLNQMSDAKVIHPLISAALVNATILVGTAIAKRQLKTTFFDQPVS